MLTVTFLNRKDGASEILSSMRLLKRPRYSKAKIMKLEYLSHGSDDCPLIRFYNFDLAQTESLLSVFEQLANDTAASVALHELQFIEAVDGCHLTAITGVRESGADMITPREAPNTFTWVASRQEWNHVIELITPPETLMQPDHYQWLTDDLGIQILFSQTGLW